MVLLVIRHAIARERSARHWADDALRPLSTKGVLRFRRAALGIARHIGVPKVLYSSPLVRAWQTAQILTTVAHWPVAQTLPLLAPDASQSELLRFLGRIDQPRVALVGHEPDLSQLVVTLLGGGNGAKLQFKKGGLAQLEFPARIAAGLGSLQCLLPPRVLRSMAGK